jgi:hypothetical protein
VPTEAVLEARSGSVVALGRRNEGVGGGEEQEAVYRGHLKSRVKPRPRTKGSLVPSDGKNRD